MVPELKGPRRAFRKTLTWDLAARWAACSPRRVFQRRDSPVKTRATSRPLAPCGAIDGRGGNGPPSIELHDAETEALGDSDPIGREGHGAIALDRGGTKPARAFEAMCLRDYVHHEVSHLPL